MSIETNTLEYMCELIVDCPHSTPKWTDNGLIVLRNQNIKGGILDINNPSYTNEDDFKKRIKRAAPQVGDIVFTREAPMGEVCLIPEGLKCCLGQRQVLLRPKKEVNGKYLFWALQSPYVQQQISWNEGTGSTVSNVRIPILKNLNIPRHKDKEDQIADILSSIADKIELNRQINQTLESMAQAIFKSWFVDFEPVKAKIAALESGEDAEGVTRAAMRAISGKSDYELDKMDGRQSENYAQLKTTAELFPSAMQDSELGEVPEGWEVKPMDKIAHYQNGLALQKFRPENEDEYLPVLKIAQLKKGFADGGEKASVNIKSECIVNNGDVVFSWSGSLMVDIWCGGKVALNQHLFKVTSEKYSKWFYYYWTKHHLSEFQRIASAKAVTMGHIKREHLSSAFCTTPDSQILEKSSKIIDNLIEKSIEIRLENVMLQNLRDTLLPKLLSGELSVDALKTTNEQGVQ